MSLDPAPPDVSRGARAARALRGDPSRVASKATQWTAAAAIQVPLLVLFLLSDHPTHDGALWRTVGVAGYLVFILVYLGLALRARVRSER